MNIPTIEEQTAETNDLKKYGLNSCTHSFDKYYESYWFLAKWRKFNDQIKILEANKFRIIF